MSGEKFADWPDYLRTRGWIEDERTRSKWRWRDPLFRWLQYTEAGAVDAQRFRDAQRVRKGKTKRKVARKRATEPQDQ